MHRRALLIASLALGCGKDKPPPAPAVTSATAATRPADDPCAKAKAQGPLRWIEEDYPAALACAKARHLPLVLDLWATWCHTCLSMKATVFRDPSFAADATRFVFASLDTDREDNAAVLARLPLSAWPTFYVISPDQAVLARFAGGATVAQFHAFLDAGITAMKNGAIGADAHLLAAERATTTKDLATAERELEAALLDSPAAWPRRADALVSLLQLKRKRGDLAGCLRLAETSMDDTGNGASATDFLAIALECGASGLKTEPDRVAALRKRAAARLQKLIEDPAAPLTADDRSDAMAYLRSVLEELGQADEAKAVAERQRVLLDDAAAKAPTAMAAMTYNSHRAEVYSYLGRPLDIVPALEKSARDLPTEFDPPARLGRILLEGGKLAEAAAWADKAIALAYGPRKARVLALRAEIAAKQGDAPAERRFRQDVVTLWESLPPGQTNPDALASARKVLADLGDAAGVRAAP